MNPAGLEPAASSFGGLRSRPSELRIQNPQKPQRHKEQKVSPVGVEPTPSGFVDLCSGPFELRAHSNGE